MLAVQQPPRMGSSHPDSDPFLPFGYSMDQNQDGLLDAPDPAGAPLLSETDTKFLSSFFEDMSSAQYNMPSFGEGLHFSDAWFDLPPQFMGTATSFGPQASALPNPDAFLGEHIDFTGAVSSAPQLMRPPSVPMSQPPQAQHRQVYQHQQHQQQQQQHRHHSDDVLTAAATLLQNNSSSPRSNGKGKEASPATRRPLGPPMGHLRHQPMDEFKEESKRDLENEADNNTFTDWMFGSKDRHGSRPEQVNELHWGSDANFGNVQGYVPSPTKETADGHHKVQMQVLGCLKPNDSVPNTRCGSPIVDPQRVVPPSQSAGLADDADAPPRKRRKSKLQRGFDDNDDDDESSAPSSFKKSKSPHGSSNGLPSPPAESSSSRRRKSGLGKGPRENLSEQQKRSNHIRSEQKRRTLIKEGFDDLCELVPGLKGGGFSKSTMLTMSAEWLEQLLQGNQTLSAQLQGMGQ
ncbi:Helix-loop-helix DNA-binding [Cordyceps militaris]|uniref:Helix-loop-helix DNA-binding n=1 Tax=Cordyceps militaris TaxID=73501 RepID=A0A2H4SU74_CORMI|nr:Helix-loop-helix DNA-binding [Cordyceps militaris]